MIVSLVLSHGALHEELGVGQEMKPKLKRKLRLGLAEGILAAQPSAESHSWE
jgi:hypothetical protein